MPEKNYQKAIATWLLIGVAMIIVQVLLGGITRLTGSGLSIAEWKPLLGAVPPMNEKSWSAAFELYKQKASGQFTSMNAGFTLSDFKSIYFWEWMHREWGRFMGLVFAAGFIYFIIKKAFKQEMVMPLVVLFVLGGLQGAIGWIMVQSGLNENDTHVNHIRLAIHFIAALGLLCYVLWFALGLLIPEEKRYADAKLRRYTVIITCILVLQLMYGAFMAGLKAAPAAPTWPKINNSWVVDNPQSFGTNTYQGVHIYTDNPLMIHLIHRCIAYVLFFAIIAWFGWALMAAQKAGKPLFQKTAWLPFGLVVLQVLLGIYTVLAAPQMTNTRFGPFEYLAESHQLVAMFLLMSLVTNLYILKRK